MLAAGTFVCSPSLKADSWFKTLYFDEQFKYRYDGLLILGEWRLFYSCSWCHDLPLVCWCCIQVLEGSSEISLLTNKKRKQDPSNSSYSLQMFSLMVIRWRMSQYLVFHFPSVSSSTSRFTSSRVTIVRYSPRLIPTDLNVPASCSSCCSTTLHNVPLKTLTSNNSCKSCTGFVQQRHFFSIASFIWGTKTEGKKNVCVIRKQTLFLVCCDV